MLNSKLMTNGLKVLLVDDDRDTCELLTLMLNLYGIEVTSVNSAPAGLEAVASLHPDVLISDIAMPDEDGYSLIRKVRSLDAEHGGSVLAIAITAAVTGIAQYETFAAGFQRYLAKPFDPEELVAVVSDLMDKQS
ncbi:response regulator [Leptolyngbya sp. FACHB-671]|uniref:response regulator n=1 Tax=unclassified Leptolyngbya TaxID=2650499 RepID=UPI0016827BE7|nr:MULTISPECIES: response regulator [unclassified Leptolyngbya]MBD1868507.1 response regulator [Cyanobacteria bacterium FACHB-471]MBD1998788.1 response regulator [Leptolyngbya sp. FACHB-541]MBD2072297.1 response regulator [Leptolyngbya sp. FACHB-671]